jgi:NADPH-dependent 2,4-dienoyl-CoA reductase/sulfur reductase-like enzyme/pSer/pThr/pTyr-binding forkhead associated (FHA) protein
MVQGKHFVIIGDGAAGFTAAQNLRETSPLARITILADDPHPAYYRAALTNYLLGELTENQVWAATPTFFYDYRIERVLARVAHVDGARSQLWLSSGHAPVVYDQLLIGSGAHARPPPFEGAHLPGVSVLRTLQDARWVMDSVLSHGAKQAVVVGGGALAIEWAIAMRERGVSVTLLVRDTRVMQGPLDATASDLVLARMRQAGIDVRTTEEVHAVGAGQDGRVAFVTTKNGQQIPCQLVCVAIGVVPNSYFLANSGVELGERKGILVDDRMCTSVPNVYVAGDVVDLKGQLLQLWEPARHQAMVAAANMIGGDERYRPGVHYFATRLADLDFASVGEVRTADGMEELVDRSQKTGSISYRKLLVKDGKLVGALMLGLREERVRQRGRSFKQLVDEQISIHTIKQSLLDPGFDLKAWLRGRMLVKKPVPPPAPKPAAPVPAPGAAPAVKELSPAELRGTQMLNLNLRASIGAAANIQIIGLGATLPVADKPAAKQGAPMLTIGLPLASLPTAVAPAGSVAGYFEAHGQRWPLDGEVMSIGSQASCQIVLTDPAISGIHAQVTLHNDEHFLRDLGSQTGTWVNGKAVTVPHRLRNGDSVQLGATTLRYGSDRGSQTALPSDGAVSADEEPQPSLVVRAGPCFGLSFALRGNGLSVGREPGSAVLIDDTSISRRHAVLNNHDGAWYVCDMHSSRGSFRNGARLPPGQDVPLAEGDQVQFGDSLLMFTSRPPR